VRDVGPDAAAVDEPVDGGKLDIVALGTVGGAQAGDALSGCFVRVGGCYLGSRGCGRRSCWCWARGMGGGRREAGECVGGFAGHSCGALRRCRVCENAQLLYEVMYEAWLDAFDIGLMCLDGPSCRR
jgi:hypothetical protein